jgi:DNA-binding PadR family transcriptional regulator
MLVAAILVTLRCWVVCLRAYACGQTAALCRWARGQTRRRLGLRHLLPMNATIEIDGLRKRFGPAQALNGMTFTVGPGEVTGLGRLERDGLAESEGAGQDGPQKRYRITAGGREALAAWLRTPPDLTSPPRDELVMKVLVAARLPGTDAHEVIQAHRLYLLELMQQWTRLKEGEARADLSLALVVDAELFRLDAVIRWLDAADVRLARAAAGPPGPASVPGPAPRLRRLGARR